MKKRIFAIAVAVMLICALFTVSAFAVTENRTYVFKTGDFISSYYVDQGSNITNVSVSGSLPSGIQIANNDTQVWIYGMPDTAGTYYAQINVTKNGEAVTYVCTFTVSGAPVSTSQPSYYVYQPLSITKSPTDETVKTGEDAVFVARADNAQYLEWRFKNADKSKTYSVAEIKKEKGFENLEIDGFNTERLVLKNIPAAMDGYSVQCKYMGFDGTTAYTNYAKVTVSDAAAPASPTPTIAPIVTPSPTIAPVINTNNPSYTGGNNGTGTGNGTTGSNPAITHNGTSGNDATVDTTINNNGAAGDPNNVSTIDNTGTGADGTSASRSGASGTTILLYVLIVLAVLALLAILVLLLRNRLARAAVPQVQVRCNKCGWVPDDPNDIPKYCPECGEIIYRGN